MTEKNTDFISYGDMEEDTNDSDEDGDKGSDGADDYSAPEEDEEMVDEPVPPVGPHLVHKDESDPQLKAKAVVGQLSVWNGLLEQIILLQKVVAKVDTFPQDLAAFLEPGDEEHEEHVKEVKKTSQVSEKLVNKSGQLRSCLDSASVEDEVGVQLEARASLQQIGRWLEETNKKAGGRMMVKSNGKE